MRSGIPNSVATHLASGWARQLSSELVDHDERLAKIEASNLARQYARTHVDRLGSLTKPRPDGVFCLLGGQMNSAASAETCLRKSGDLVRLCQEFEVQGVALSEVGVNWSTFPDRQTWPPGFTTTFLTSEHMRRTTGMRVLPTISLGERTLLHVGSWSDT